MSARKYEGFRQSVCFLCMFPPSNPEPPMPGFPPKTRQTSNIGTDKTLSSSSNMKSLPGMLGNENRKTRSGSGSGSGSGPGWSRILLVFTRSCWESSLLQREERRSGGVPPPAGWPAQGLGTITVWSSRRRRRRSDYHCMEQEEEEE